jgi:hypothetical protein
MNIIFKENLPAGEQKYTVLDLDTFVMPSGSLHTACCVVENIPITELAHTENYKNLHTNLIKNLALKNWSYCEQAIEQLMGKWGGELDTFYADLLARVAVLQTKELPEDWTPVIHKK